MDNSTVEVEIVTIVSLAATKAAHAAYASSIQRSLALKVDPEFAMEEAVDCASEAAHQLAREFCVQGVFEMNGLQFVAEEVEPHLDA
jgi:hypothetical protein